MRKPTAKHIALHKAAAAAVKHLKKLPAGTRRKLGSLPASHLNYNSLAFHQKVKLPYQKHNVENWGGRPYGPSMKC
jgi:hypothetical protein